MLITNIFSRSYTINNQIHIVKRKKSAQNRRFKVNIFVAKKWEKNDSNQDKTKKTGIGKDDEIGAKINFYRGAKRIKKKCIFAARNYNQIINQKTKVQLC